jgi:hypothetical protein
MKYTKILFAILSLSSLLSCKSTLITPVTDYALPIVSIDSTFKVHRITNGEYHANRLTRSFSKVLDSIAMDSVMMFVPNYRLFNKVPSTYTLSAILSPAKSPDAGLKKPVASLRGFITDNVTDQTSDAMGCFGKDVTDWGCFSYDKRLPDSTNYEGLRETFYFGMSEIKSLVPLHKLLVPNNSDLSSKISFSIEKPIHSSLKEDREAALILTQIVNNNFVFNQASFSRRVIKNRIHYNYYANYLHDRSERKKANFTISAVLKRSSTDSYELKFKFKGKDVNTVTSGELNTTVSFNIERFKTKDYSEAMRQISELLVSFLYKNTMFN